MERILGARDNKMSFTYYTHIELSTSLHIRQNHKILGDTEKFPFLNPVFFTKQELLAGVIKYLVGKTGHYSLPF